MMIIREKDKREVDLGVILVTKTKEKEEEEEELQGVTRKKQTATDLLVLTRLFGT